MFLNVANSNVLELDNSFVNTTARELSVAQSGAYVPVEIYYFHKMGHSSIRKTDCYQTIYTVSGKGVITIGGVDQFINPGSYIILPKGEEYRIRNIDEVDLTVIQLAGDRRGS